MDSMKNLAGGVVASPPVPAASGTTLQLGPGQGARLPTPPFNATVWPARYVADPENAEIVRVTARDGDLLTFSRAQEGTTAVVIQQGYRFDAGPTAKVFADVASLVDGKANLADLPAIYGPGGTAGNVSAAKAAGAAAGLAIVFGG